MSNKPRKKQPTLTEADRELFRQFIESDEIIDKDAVNAPAHHPVPLKKNSSPNKSKVDLHGKTLAEATTLVDNHLSQLVAHRQSGHKIRIITGKGRHSSGGTGVLIREVYDYVKRRWSPHIKTIDSPPADDLIKGVPLRGHFDLTLK